MEGSAEMGLLSVADGSGGGVCRKKKRDGFHEQAAFGAKERGEKRGGASDIMRLHNTGKARAMETAGSFCPFPGTRCRQRCTRSDLFFTEQLGRCFSFNGCYL